MLQSGEQAVLFARLRPLLLLRMLPDLAGLAQPPCHEGGDDEGGAGAEMLLDEAVLWDTLAAHMTQPREFDEVRRMAAEVLARLRPAGPLLPTVGARAWEAWEAVRRALSPPPSPFVPVWQKKCSGLSQLLGVPKHGVHLFQCV